MDNKPSEASSVDPPGPRSTWRSALRGNVLAMGLVSLFTDFSSEMMNPLLPTFIAGLVPLGWAAFYVGLMEGLAETTASLLKLFSGRISDRLGKRKVLVLVGYGISSIVRPAMALVAAGWQIISLKFLDRVGKGIRTSPRDALIGDSVDASFRGLAFSFHRSMDHAGAVLGPLVAIGIVLAIASHYRLADLGLWTSAEGQRPSLHEMDALRLLFAVAIVPGLAAMAVLALRVREVAPQQADSVAAGGGASGGGGGAAAGGGGEKTFVGWRDLPRNFYLFVGIVTVFALGNSSDLFLLLYARDLFGLGLVQIILLWVVLHLSKIVFSFPGGILSDRFGRRGVIVAGWSVYALVYAGMAMVHAQWQFWALFIAYGFYYGMTEGTEKALVSDFVASGRRGTAYGVYHGAIGLAALPASLLFGVFWTVIGPRWAFGIGAGCAIVATGLLSLLLTAGRTRQ